MNTNMKLLRRWLSPESTIGELYVNGHWQCFILEDVYRPPGEDKVQGQTAIPLGRYRVQRTKSPRFGIVMPLLWNVRLSDGRLLVENDGKRFEGIRMHWGNKAIHTDGCLITGKVRLPDEVQQSVAAYRELDRIIEDAERQGEVYLEVEFAHNFVRLAKGERA